MYEALNRRALANGRRGLAEIGPPTEIQDHLFFWMAEHYSSPADAEEQGLLG